VPLPTFTIPACLAALLLAAAGGLAGPADADAKRRGTTVVVPMPRSGDLTYAVAQVRIARAQAPREGRGARVVRARVGGLKVRARARGWAKRARTTKVRVAVTRVSGGGGRLRNVVFLVARRKAENGPARGGTVRFTIANARPVVKSFWVHRVRRDGRADVFRTRNALSTALRNWSRYVSVLKAARALKAAHEAIDATGELSTQARPSARRARLHTAGTPVSRRSLRLLRLMFGTLGDRAAYQAVKRSPLVEQFIRRDLDNPALARRWSRVVGILPQAVPDRYAASARQEAKFGRVSSPRISRQRVVIADTRNASSQAAIETPRMEGDNVPGTPVEVRIEGTGRGHVRMSPSGGRCDTTCSRFFTSGQEIELEAVQHDGSSFGGWEGCTGGTRGRLCYLEIDATKVEPTRSVVVRFESATPPAPAPPAPAPAPAPPTTPAPGGGTAGGGGSSGGGGATPSDGSTFRPTVLYPARSHPVGVGLGDFNSDGAYDIAVPEDALDFGAEDLLEVRSGRLESGDPTGAFGSARSISLGADADPSGVAADDFDIDGYPDVAVSLSQIQNGAADDAVALLLSTGAGGLSSTASLFPTGPGAADIAAGDLNGERFPEIVTVGATGPGDPGVVSIVPNLGVDAPPRFGAPQQFSSGGVDAGSVALGDLDGDFRLDVVVGNLGDGSVTVLRNTTPIGATTLSFDAAQTVLDTPADRYPLDLTVADIDRDGRRDIVVADHVHHSATVLRNTTSGGGPLTFDRTTYPASGGDPLGRHPTGVVVADFDYDGLEDIAMSNFVSDNISLLRGTGGGGLAAATHQDTDAGPRGLASAYLNPDARPDLVVADFGRYPDGSGAGERAGSVAVLLAR